MLRSSRPGIEDVKHMNMVDFLSRYYGLDFSKSSASVFGPGNGQGSANQYCCLSPFKEERNPSFFVREEDGHWLFKDFSSGYGGSIIDFVLLKENLNTVGEALSYIKHLLCGDMEPGPGEAGGDKSSTSSTSGCKTKPYDVKLLYNTLRRNDVSSCRKYLLERHIAQELVDLLCRRELLLHNQYKGVSYCCFAVFNNIGELCCLDNHQMGGDGKFVLGHKHPFSLDWDQLASSERVFVTEGIIDYLSLKTIEGFEFRGVALLGNILNFNGELFGSAREIVSALDGDSGGFRAFLDLEEMFSDRMIGIYNFGDCKDANEYLQKSKDKERTFGKRLNAEDKLSLYRDFQTSQNKAELAKKWGINRSYMYEIVNECEKLILSGFSNRSQGRKPDGQPVTMDEAWERVKELEANNRLLDEERERFFVRSEFMKVRLKWAELEAEELRKEAASKGTTPNSQAKNRKEQIKKKLRRKS